MKKVLSKVSPLLIILGILLLILAGSIVFAESASAHGYMESSRAHLCSTDENVNCGLIKYEPQSLEAPKGYPNAGPADGKIASAGGAFPDLDQQTSNRWKKVGKRYLCVEEELLLHGNLLQRTL
jgi:predicted carbohydrate-binding protein with CBM5 and CBM33 domain